MAVCARCKGTRLMAVRYRMDYVAGEDPRLAGYAVKMVPCPDCEGSGEEEIK